MTVKVGVEGMPDLPENAEQTRKNPVTGYFTHDKYPKQLRGRQIAAKGEKNSLVWLFSPEL